MEALLGVAVLALAALAFAALAFAGFFKIGVGGSAAFDASKQ